MRYRVVDEFEYPMVECDRVRFACGIIFFYVGEDIIANIKDDVLYYISNLDRQWHEYDARKAEIQGIL